MDERIERDENGSDNDSLYNSGEENEMPDANNRPDNRLNLVGDSDDELMVYDSDEDRQMPDGNDRPDNGLNLAGGLDDDMMVHDPEEELPNHNDQQPNGEGNEGDEQLIVDSEDSDEEEVGVDDSDEDPQVDEDDNIHADFFHMNVERGGLDQPLLAQGNMMKIEKLLLEIGKTLRYKHSYASMLTSFKIANLSFNNAQFPTTMEAFWKLVNRNLNNFRRSISCTICWDDLGVGKKPNRVCRCGETGPGQITHLGTFLYLNLPAQLQGLLAKPGMASALEYPWTRVKNNPDAIEDVYDGSVYRRLSADGGFLHRGSLNYSLAIWTDGVDPVISAPVTIWPIFVQVLELSPRARQRNSLLAGLYIGPRAPQMAKFLTPFTTELRNLYLHGITWQPDGAAEVSSRFVTLIVAADSEARSPIMGMMRHNAMNGCTFCNAQGVKVGGNQDHIYRYLDGRPEDPRNIAPDRTDAEIRQDAQLASRRADGQPVNGVQALSALSIVPGLDLRSCQLVEALHCLWEMNMTRLYSLLISLETENHLTKPIIREISRLIQSVKPPTKLASYPRPLEYFANYKGTEYRNLAWYYWLPCAHVYMTPEQIEHCSLFIDATYILNKDSILPQELINAENKLDRYRQQSEQMFPERQQTYCLHLLKHNPRCVQELGPLFVTSGFWFESLNRQVKNYITSPTDCATQVAGRILLAQMVEKSLDWDLSPDVLNNLRECLLKARLVVAPENATGRFTQHARAVQRLLNQQEIAALAEAGYHGINQVTRHQRVCIDGINYQPESDKPVKYDNSVVHVTPPNVDDPTQFIRIMSIIKWQRGVERMEGVIGCRFITVGAAFNTSYMKIVQESQSLIYLPLTCLNAPAVLVKSAGRIYVSPIPNRWDVD